MKLSLTVLLIFAVLGSLVVGLQAAEVVKANWIAMPQSPITDKPTLIIHSPFNNTSYVDDVRLDFTVTKPNSWMPAGGKPYGGIRSITYILDRQESKVYTAKNNPPYDELEASTNFSIPLNEALSNGTHTLKLTVVGVTIYWEFPTPPPNAHNWASSPVIHEYSISVSQTVTFTTSIYIESTPSLTQTPTLSPTPSPAITPKLSPIVIPTNIPTQQPTLSPLPTSTISLADIEGWYFQMQKEKEFILTMIGLITVIAAAIIAVIYFKKRRG